MSNWEESLRDKMKTPEQKAAEERKQQEELRQRIKGLMTTCYREMLKTFDRAHKILVANPKSNSSLTSPGGMGVPTFHDVLSFTGGTVALAVAEPEHNAILVTIDGTTRRLIFNATTKTLGWEDAPSKELSVGKVKEYLGEVIDQMANKIPGCHHRSKGDPLPPEWRDPLKLRV